MADPHIQMGEVLKEARKKTDGPYWSYPKREGFLAADAMAQRFPVDAEINARLYGDDADPAPSAFAGVAARYPYPVTEDSPQQGSLARALRVVRGYLTYVVTFAAGWFASAVYSLGILKGWW